MFQKNSCSFCPVRDVILVEKHHLFTFSPVRDIMFSLSHYVPDGTLVTGGIHRSTDILSLTGQNPTFFRPDFSKTRNITFFTHICGNGNN